MNLVCFIRANIPRDQYHNSNKTHFIYWRCTHHDGGGGGFQHCVRQKLSLLLRVKHFEIINHLLVIGTARTIVNGHRKKNIE